MINHLWAFNAETCAHARTAEAHAAGDYDRAKAEHYGALGLAFMANEACERMYPMPTDMCDIDGRAAAELARTQCVTDNTGIPEADHAEWFWRTTSSTGRWAAPEWREGAECFD